MSIVAIDEPLVQVSEPVKEIVEEESESQKLEFVQKRKSMDVNEFRRPSLAELHQEEVDEIGEDKEGDGEENGDKEASV